MGLYARASDLVLAGKGAGDGEEEEEGWWVGQLRNTTASPGWVV